MISALIREYVRTMVRGDTDESARVEDRLDKEGWPGAHYFVASCFYLAVRRYFSVPPDHAAIIRFVADVRAWVDADEPDVDPTLAEQLISSVLDGSVHVNGSALDQEMLGRVELLVVYTILTRLELSERELDAFLDEAMAMATSEAL